MSETVQTARILTPHPNSGTKKGSQLPAGGAKKGPPDEGRF